MEIKLCDCVVDQIQNAKFNILETTDPRKTSVRSDIFILYKIRQETIFINIKMEGEFPLSTNSQSSTTADRNMILKDVRL